jgi:riboflavin synthase
MFTGLIEETGCVAALEQSPGGRRLVLEIPRIAGEIREGDSLAVNGCCLTAIPQGGSRVAFYLLEETLARTNLGLLAPGAVVNLERALAAGGRLGGHFVQGHVDCTSEVLSIGADDRFEVALPGAFSQYVAFKGSIAVNGISLTVAELLERSFVVFIIPHTREHTNLGSAKPGDLMNLEFDILAKYVERILEK